MHATAAECDNEVGDYDPGGLVGMHQQFVTPDKRRVKELRQQRGLSKKAFERRVDGLQPLSRNTITRVEQGKPVTLATMEIVAARLKVRVEELILGGSLRRDGRFTLEGWPGEFEYGSIVVGDRRDDESPTISELFVGAPSCVDLTFAGPLFARPGVCIRSDRIPPDATPAELLRYFGRDQVVVGAPSVNLLAGVVNETACFPFYVDQTWREGKEALRAQAATTADLAAWAGRHAAEVRQLRRYSGMYMFTDPIQRTPFGYRRECVDHGVITLCASPVSSDGVSVLAAGLGALATMKAVERLGIANAFEGRPLGGIFRATWSRETRWCDRERDCRFDWVTPEYTVDGYRECLDHRPALTEAYRDRIHGLLARLEARASLFDRDEVA